MTINGITTTLFSVLLLSSCMVKEQITPLAESINLSDLQREQLLSELERQGQGSLGSSVIDIESAENGLFYLSVKYNIRELDVFDAIGVENQFEDLAGSFLGAISEIVLNLGGPQEIEMDEISIDLSELEFDPSIVKSIHINRIYLQYDKSLDEQSDFSSSFSFIDYLDLSQQISVLGFGEVDDLLFTYKRSQTKCFHKCLDFSIYTKNLIDLIKSRESLVLKPSISITSMPQVTDLKIQGYVRLRIGLKLPF